MTPSTVGHPLPLTPLQGEILLHTLGAPGTGVHIHQIRGKLDPTLESGLLEAWARAIQRHPSLRSRFVWDREGDPVRVVEAEAGFPWHEHDWRGLSQADAHEGLEELLSAIRTEGFDPGRAPLHRLDLIRLPDGLVVAWTFHHLLADEGTSLRILNGTLAEARRIAGGEMLSPTHQEEEELAPPEPEGAEEFWRPRLAGVEGPTSVVGRGRGPGAVPVASACTGTGLDPLVSAELEALARREELPLEALVRGAWGILLARQAGEEDIVLGLLSGSAEGSGFRNPLPLPTPVPATHPVMEWVRELHREAEEAARFAAVVPARLRGWSGMPAGTPLVEALLVWRDADPGSRVPGEAGSDFELSTRWGWPLVLEATAGETLSLHRLGWTTVAALTTPRRVPPAPWFTRLTSYLDAACRPKPPLSNLPSSCTPSENWKAD